MGSACDGIDVFSLIIRFGEINKFYIDVTKIKFANYTVGSAATFNIWFNHSMDADLGFGVNTFTGILKTVGLATRKKECTTFYQLHPKYGIQMFLRYLDH